MSNLIDKIPLVIRAALARAAWTFIVVLVPALGTGAATDLDYLTAANIALGAAVLSFAKSLIVGMPETVPVEFTSQTDYSNTAQGFVRHVVASAGGRVVAEAHFAAPAIDVPTPVKRTRKAAPTA